MIRKYLIVLFVIFANMQTFSQTWDELNDQLIANYNEGNYTLAIEYGEKALKQCKTEFGKKHGNYGISLNNLAFMYQQVGQYEKALPIYLEAFKHTEKYVGTNNPDYSIGLINLASLYEQIGDFDQALSFYLKTIQNTEEVFGKDHPNYGNRLISLAGLYEKMGQYDEAVNSYYKAIENTKVALGKDDPKYGIRLNNLAGLYEELGQYAKALPLYIESIECAEKLNGKNNLDYCIRMSNLAGIYRDMNQYEKAIPLYDEALEIIKNIQGENLSNYGILLSNMAILYNRMGQYDKALPLYIEALENTEKTLGKDHPVYGNRLNNLALLYQDMEKYDLALSFFIQALENTEKTSGKNHPDYGIRLNNLAGLYMDLGQYDKALPLYLESLKNAEMNLGKDHPDYNVRLGNLGLLYEQMGQYDKAQPLLLESLVNTEKTLGKENSEYGIRLNALALLYKDMGQYGKSLLYYLEALENTEKALGKNHSDYGIRLNNLALLYQDMGQYDKALPLLKEALKNAEETLGKNHSYYGIRLSNLALLYKKMGQYEKALPLYLESLENIEKTLGKTHPEYGIRLNNLAVLYENMGQYDNALLYYKEALENTENALGKDHPEYGISLNNLAALYQITGKYNDALPLYKEALENAGKALGKEHSQYGIRLNNLAILYEKTRQYEKAYPLFLEAKENLYHQLNTTFTFTTETEKEKFYQNNIVFNFNVYRSFYNEYYPENNLVAGEYYNDELVQKGILLQSNSALQNAIYSSGNNELIALYNVFRNNKIILIEQTDLPLSDRIVNIDSLQRVIDDMEREITMQASKLSCFKGFFNTNLNWKSVQNILHEGEAAIEFSSFQYYNNNTWTDSTLYYALVLRKEDTNPQMIYLCEEKELIKILGKNKSTSGADFVNQLYGSRGTRLLNNVGISNKTSKDLYSIIWKPVDSLLQDITKVYYAPSGLLHTVAFAALKTDSTHYLSDNYQLVSLSSTRQLVEGKEVKLTNVQSSALYGGIDYNADTTVWQQETAHFSNNTSDDYFASRSYLPTDSTRGSFGWPYLPGTLEEIKTIEPIVAEKKIQPLVYSDIQATEESYKALAGVQSPEIIHIATHGFYFPLETEKPNDNFNTFSREQQYNAMENPLRRAGLLLTGANHAWNNEPIPSAMEDGILTAWEVSQSWLGNTDLVVLSACETGLGEIKGGEGVFGLQRAFKMAGANYIMMSLWQVPDKETAEFMETFYTNWFGGMEIREAFLQTQNSMKAKYDPYYWAAFVLVQ